MRSTLFALLSSVCLFLSVSHSAVADDKLVDRYGGPMKSFDGSWVSKRMDRMSFQINRDGTAEVSFSEAGFARSYFLEWELGPDHRAIYFSERHGYRKPYGVGRMHFGVLCFRRQTFTSAAAEKDVFDPGKDDVPLTRPKN